MVNRIATAILLTFAAHAICPNSRATEQPRLVVFISIDQFRADHLERYAREYSAGFKTLTSEGIWFTQAFLNYAISSTGPGHATLSTGVYPWKSGIVSNNWRDRTTKQKMYCVEDSTALPVDGEGGGRSPRNLLTTAVGDWLQSASPTSRVVSISYKDRAAILMGGKKPSNAFWYDRATGHMVTSSYYTRTLPTWVKAFNDADWIGHNTPASWTKLKDESVYAAYGPDNFPGEAISRGTSAFPHPINPEKRTSQVFDTPFGNTMLLDFARAAIRGEQLGKRGVPDLLCISLSTTDNIGGNFGPNSHEMIDNLIRLDGNFSSFLGELVSTVGREHLLVVLSGDHGVMPLPEYLTAVAHQPARRLDNRQEIDRALKGLDSTMRHELKTDTKLIGSGTLNYPAAVAAGISVFTFETRIREALKNVDGVGDVYFRRELLDSTTPPRPYLEAYRHSNFPDRAPDYVLRDCEYCLATTDSTGTSHGSPYAYDTCVPIVMWGLTLSPLKVDRAVHTVDIAATLAKALGIQSPTNLDGVPLEEVFR
jgi:predicted AlkP superfamily pyrophosphatase or phosphodiesterase